MTEPVEVTTASLGRIDYGSIIALCYGEPGAMGEAGCIEFSTVEGRLYHLNYLDGSVPLEALYRVYPDCPLATFPALPREWRYFYLEAGNHLWVNERAYRKYLQNKGEEEPDKVYSWWRSTIGKPLMSKQERYSWLIEKVRESYLREGNGGTFTWCDACRNEINLWTYWQGKGCLEPDILVVGQDWGNPHKEFGKICLENITAQRPYLENNFFPTDQNLVELFRRGLKIDVAVKNERVFFTNLILGYRTVSNTEKFSTSWFRHDLMAFKSLVCLLRPKVVICLGRETYVYALAAFGKQVKFSKGYIAALEAGQTIYEMDGIRFYGVAHSGTRGCLNRAQYSGGKESSVKKGLDLQCGDWARIQI